MIPVNKPYFPDLGKYQRYIEGIYDRAWLTNNGPMVEELKGRLEDYLGVKNLLPVANGTLALQLAYKALDITGNAVTTPFTFVATASSLKWEGISPRFADINPHTLNLCPEKTEALINTETSAIVPVHVYGNPCAVDNFEKLAQKHNLKIVYDAAHAFGIKRNGNSILNYGDAATLSFHATKVFHTVEGGAIVFKDNAAYERAVKMINFGIDTSDGSIVDYGINAKMSEVHAAMGLAMLDNMDEIIDRRCELHARYLKRLEGIVQIPEWDEESSQNGAYMPVIFDNEETCTLVFEKLKENHIFARKYFSPSLNEVVALSQECFITPVSKKISKKILCLPLYHDLSNDEVDVVTNSLIKVLL